MAESTFFIAILEKKIAVFEIERILLPIPVDGSERRAR